MENPSGRGMKGNKKTDPLVSFLRTITDVVWYSGLGLAAIVLAALVFTAFPEFSQDKIFLPIQLDVRDPDVRMFSGVSAADFGPYGATAQKITASTKDLFVIRVLLSYYLAVVLGICAAVFFWRKIVKAFRGPNFFSKDNRSYAVFLGWLLIAYFPVHAAVGKIAESLIDFRIGRADLGTSLGSGYHAGIVLVMLGLLILFLSRVIDKGAVCVSDGPKSTPSSTS